MQEAGAQTVKAAFGRWANLSGMTWAELRLLAGPTLTLSVLLSFDTLKTCVVVDACSRDRHDSNRELVGQGLANVVSALCGGLAGSGQLGATMVNIDSGARTRLSSVLEGLFCLAAFLALGRLIAWVPVAALAGVLAVVSLRMFDVNAFSLPRYRSTVFDFAVVATVMIAAVLGNLIAASAVGLGMSILLFIRDQMRTSVVRRMTDGSRRFSKLKRPPSEMKILERNGARTAICELQGSLFFGTADQLYTKLEKNLSACRFVVLNMRRVQAVDLTARRVLEQMDSRLRERGGRLILSDLPHRLPSGLELANYFSHRGRGKEHARIFPEMDDALAWAEDQLLAEENLPARESAPALSRREVGLLSDFGVEADSALGACLQERTVASGDAVFRRGDPGDELFIIRRGRVRIVLPLSATRGHHLATFTRGDFFGEIAFLDGDSRTADASALSDTELFVISRRLFDAAARTAPALSVEVFSRLAQVLAQRLRRTNAELLALQED
jgi:SulP family sulfate permease